MLGKLAKWLRILGYDTYYQSYYPAGALDQSVMEGRRLLTRRRETAVRYADALLINADRVGKQIIELKEKAPLKPLPAKWFTRCLVCNTLLEKVEKEKARENVPEYVFYQDVSGIRVCPSCGRYYWQGSHRKRMRAQLEAWGFIGKQLTPL
ncbi:MAG: hypothetical protein DRH11_14400 [Deltaproteobacteria bacterium]|nr:MAG: hypothetical protein DRH11_14400 [Deltaproteobacteria bacterium]